MKRPELVVLGGSWGGLDAIGTVLGGLPPAFPPAIAIAQHRGRGSGAGLAGALAARAGREVTEVHDKDPTAPGGVYLAPADYHLLVEPDHFSLSTEAPVHWSRPSIDVLFESAANAYGERLVAVLLTGSGSDGAAGLAHVRRRGGVAVVQDPRTAVRSEMPAAAIAAGAADAVLPLGGISGLLAERCLA